MVLSLPLKFFDTEWYVYCSFPLQLYLDPLNHHEPNDTRREKERIRKKEGKKKKKTSLNNKSPAYLEREKKISTFLPIKKTKELKIFTPFSPVCSLFFLKNRQ